MGKFLVIAAISVTILSAQSKTLAQMFQAVEYEPSGGYCFAPPGTNVNVIWSDGHLSDVNGRHGVVRFQIPAEVYSVTVTADDGAYCMEPTEYVLNGWHHTLGNFLNISMHACQGPTTSTDN